MMRNILTILFSLFTILQPSLLNSKYLQKVEGVLSKDDLKVEILTNISIVDDESTLSFERYSKTLSLLKDADFNIYPFGDPAGCSPAIPEDLSPEARLQRVQDQLGSELNLKSRLNTYIWNGVQGRYFDTSVNQEAYEFKVNEYQSPFTYRGDKAAAIFVQNGFAVWFRKYAGNFWLLAVPINIESRESVWDEYIDAYWLEGGSPPDETIVKVSKKLPCHWMLDVGFVDPDDLHMVFDLDWQLPNYLQAGRKYLASSCREANRISQEDIGYWSAKSMCGPLTWQILYDANSFPYRIGNYNTDSSLFINANPRYWGTRPWSGFDPETYDLVVRTNAVMAWYDFDSKGNLYPGDILFSYGSPHQWSVGGGNFSHIFMVAGIDEDQSRLAITNMVKDYRGVRDCSISEVVLYKPGENTNGVMRLEWNGHGYGVTGKYGFDVFRWKWIAYHEEGRSREYEVRWGETVDTIAFDWKISPLLIRAANQLSENSRLVPGQVITLPAPQKKLELENDI